MLHLHTASYMSSLHDQPRQRALSVMTWSGQRGQQRSHSRAHARRGARAGSALRQPVCRRLHTLRALPHLHVVHILLAQHLGAVARAGASARRGGGRRIRGGGPAISRGVGTDGLHTRFGTRCLRCDASRGRCAGTAPCGSPERGARLQRGLFGARRRQQRGASSERASSSRRSGPHKRAVGLRGRGTHTRFGDRLARSRRGWISCAARRWASEQLACEFLQAPLRRDRAPQRARWEVARAKRPPALRVRRAAAPMRGAGGREAVPEIPGPS